MFWPSSCRQTEEALLGDCVHLLGFKCLSLTLMIPKCVFLSLVGSPLLLSNIAMNQRALLSINNILNMAAPHGSAHAHRVPAKCLGKVMSAY